MTEADWLSVTDPAPMLEFLKGNASERKLRLFTVACCRKAFSLLQSQKFLNAIEVSEQYADGLASDDKLRKVRSQIRESATRTIGRGLPWSRPVQGNYARGNVIAACSRNIDEVLLAVSAVCVTADSHESYVTKCKLERQLQAALLREIVQFPLGRAILNSSWLTCTVVPLAEGIYRDRAFDRMPILADALQDAGCDNEDILSHCRGPGPHVRGCWVVDLVTGRE